MKDWKKNRDKGNSQGWENKKTRENILFVKFMGDSDWSLSQNGRTKRKFKSKSAALKYARSYMRKH